MSAEGKTLRHVSLLSLLIYSKNMLQKYFLDVLYVPRGITLYVKQEHWDVQNIQKILLQHILLPCNPPPHTTV